MDGAPSSLSPEAIALAARMYDAARAGDLPVFQQALPAGLPPNMTNEKGDTLLMLAAYHGHADLVKLLIEHGADPNRLNDRGQSPLAGAIFKNEEAVIEVRGTLGNEKDRGKLRGTDKRKALLEGGADPEHGSPSALQCVETFNQGDRWRAKMEAAPGRAKAAPAEAS